MSELNNKELTDAFNRAVDIIYKRKAYSCGGYMCTVATTCYEPEKKAEICKRCITRRLIDPEEYV